MPRQNYSKVDSLPEQDLKQIQSLTANGYSFKYIHEWLETRGFNIAEKTVQNWHKRYLESIADTNEKAKNALSSLEKQERDTQPNPIIDDPQELENIKQSWGVNDINSVDIDDRSIVNDVTQKLAFDLYISVGAICKNRLNLYEQGQAKFPSEQLKALKLIYEMYAPLFMLN